MNISVSTVPRLGISAKTQRKLSGDFVVGSELPLQQITELYEKDERNHIYARLRNFNNDSLVQ